MPSIACHVADTPAAHLVTGMLAAVPDRGSHLHLAQAGRCVLGVAADERLPGESSICEDRGWAAAVVGTFDEQSDASPAHVALERVRTGGPEALARLRGVFATVVTDGRRVWAARDHVGTETLYYHEAPGRLLVVSEPKQLEAIPGLRLEPDVDVVEAIFYGEDYEPRRSVYRAVLRLGMASYLEWSETGCRVGRYWRPEALLETARLAPAEIAERFDELMCQAVRRTVRGKTAVLLSVGIDSPAVAAYAGAGRPPLAGSAVGAISAVYPQHPSVDERGLIEMLAAEYGLELQTFTPGPLKLDRLAEWVRTFDGPWAAWHPGWSEQSYRFAAERGYSVVLTGFFAELLTDLTRGLVPHLVATGRVRPALAYLAQQRARGGSRAATLRTPVPAFAPRWPTSADRRRRPVGPMPSWIDARRLARRDRAQAAAPRERWKSAQLGFLGGPQPSMDAYAKLQARCGVRARHPWSDVDLWEFFLSLPAEAKHPDSRSKALLRNVLRGRLPDVILDRRKMVFNAYITDQIDYASLRRWLVEA